MKRTPLKKSTRFSVFARDNFTCAYCGLTPPETKLVIDHIIPVVEGGTNDESNLVTSCEHCNQGKGRKILTCETDITKRLANIQDMLERIDLAKLAKRAMKARKELEKTIMQYYCEYTGKTKIYPSILMNLRVLSEDFGIECLFNYIDIAVSYLGTGQDDQKYIKYIYGIIRNHKI